MMDAKFNERIQISKHGVSKLLKTQVPSAQLKTTLKGWQHQVEALCYEVAGERVFETSWSAWYLQIQRCGTTAPLHLLPPLKYIHQALQRKVDGTEHDSAQVAAVLHQIIDPPSRIQRAILLAILSDFQFHPVLHLRPSFPGSACFSCLHAGEDTEVPLLQGPSRHSPHHLSQSALGMSPGHPKNQGPNMVVAARCWSLEELIVLHSSQATTQEEHELKQSSRPKKKQQSWWSGMWAASNFSRRFSQPSRSFHMQIYQLTSLRTQLHWVQWSEWLHSASPSKL